MGLTHFDSRAAEGLRSSCAPAPHGFSASKKLAKASTQESPNLNPAGELSYSYIFVVVCLGCWLESLGFWLRS